MKHIEKIIISNARRFGADIEVNFGAGATIILAPNGTGKTTIFEAIELALTGEIRRIAHFPDVIIRDKLDEMSVRLNFSGDKYCQANYLRARGCNKIGNHAELFQLENSLSVPYLLRLTHLLDQHSNGWFVEQDENNAGEIISKLPIGNDLNHVISKKTSLLRAISATEKRAYEDYDKARKDLSEFKELLLKMDELKIATTLTPLEEIMEKLLSVSKLVNYQIYNREPDLIQASTHFEKIRILLLQKLNKEKEIVIKLSGMKEKVQQYTDNLELLDKVQFAIFQYSDKNTNLNALIESARKEIKDAYDVLIKNKKELDRLKSVKHSFEELEKKSEQLTSKKASWEQNEKELRDLRRIHEQTITLLNKSQSTLEQHQFIDEAIAINNVNLERLKLKKTVQQQWQGLEEHNKEIGEIKIPEMVKKKTEQSKLVKLIDYEVAEAEKLYLIKKNVVDSLNKASETIQSAVSNIRKNLPEDEKCCPVCGACYEVGDLIKRIDESLNSLNPAIQPAIVEEENALNALVIVKDKQNVEIKKLLDITSELEELNTYQEENNKVIREKIQPQLFFAKTSEEAYTQIKDQIVQIESLTKEYQEKKRQLEPTVPIDEMHDMTLKKGQEERVLTSLEEMNGKLKFEIKDVTEEIKSISVSLDNVEKSLVIENIASQSIEVQQKEIDINNLQEILSKNEEDFKRNQNLYLDEKEVYSKIKANQEGIYAEWKQLELEEQPNEHELKTKLEGLQGVIVDLKASNSDMDAVQQKLALWRTAEKFHDVENEVKEKVGELDVQSYLEYLQKSSDEKNDALSNIQEKKKAVDVFFINLTAESKQIKEQIDAINEPWKGLLKRIVINPLITSAPLLSNSTLRNKPIAKTSATINGENTSIACIASEAQMADLQLTFMLAMANKYRWTPWKALLLDDPVQHHDLVHASSVFDVLRDYIINFDYQVMMSTHDTMQANFFKRKLENEGVPSKIYQLVVREGGVAVELLG